MQTPDTRCPKCNSEMEAGFLVDITLLGGGFEPMGEKLSWAKGERPQSPKGWLEKLMGSTGFYLGRVERKPVTSLRCIQCGYLELYAR